MTESPWVFRGLGGLLGFAVIAGFASGAASRDSEPASRAAALSNSPSPVAPNVDRIVFVYTPLGTVHEEWKPGPSFELGPILEPLEPLKNQLTVLEGLDLRPAARPGPGYDFGPAVMLTAAVGSAVPPLGFHLGGGPSLDHVLGAHFRSQVAIPVLNLGVGVSVARLCRTLDTKACALVGTWSDRDRPALPLNDPREAFGVAFGQTSQMLGPEIQALSTRLQAHPDPASDANLPATLRLQLDLVHQAFVHDRTRVATIQVLHWASLAPFPWLGIEEDFQQLHHHRRVADVVKVQRWFTGEIARFATQLAQTPTERGDTMLDHTLLVWITETGSGLARRSTEDIPIVLLGNLSGKLNTGRHYTFGERNHVDFLVTLARAMGVPLRRFGDPSLRPRPIAELLR